MDTIDLTAARTAKAATLINQHVGLPTNPLVLTVFPGSHEDRRDETGILWRKSGDYNTADDYWVDAALNSEALADDLHDLGVFIEMVSPESLAVTPRY